MTGAPALGRMIEDLTAGRSTPEDVVVETYERLSTLDDATVISIVAPERALRRARELTVSGPAGLPLWGVTFAVKDNIDVAGVPTTAACPAFARTPGVSAHVVQRLEAAGAIAVAKTNLDQFATGLVGTRSPHGTPRNPLHPSRVPGGSSSGSAVAVAAGAVPFALGTDTAGSGRVPAAFCGIVGAKPTRGWLSTCGVVPAVRSIDCVSVFATSVPDAWTVLNVAGGFDADDPLSRRGSPRPVPEELRIGVAGDVGVVGVDGREISLEPFFAAGDLLYGDAFVAERTAAVGEFIAAHPDDVDPTVRAIISSGSRWSAADLARAQYRLAELKRAVEAVWDSVDVIVMPTVPMHPTLDEVANDPVGVNLALGRYTSFANLLDLSAVTVPSGLSVVGPAWADAAVASVAARVDGNGGWKPSVESDTVTLAVVGAHLRGMPLHHQLVELGASFEGAVKTAPCYRLYALAGTVPAKPGLVRVTDGTGGPIEVEVYRLSHEAFGRFVAAVPPPLCIGTIELEVGPTAGFLCEPAGVEGARDITALGGWRAYLTAG